MFFFHMLCPSIFPTVFSYRLRNGREESKKTQGGSNLGFWDLLAHFEAQEARNFGSACVTKQQVFSTLHTNKNNERITPKPRVALRSMAKRSSVERTML